jgi:antitoxin component YwqK of YwqJK toxin-antitoxin module
MKKETAIEYGAWVGFCTGIFMRRYLRSGGFQFKTEEIEYLICNLKELYTVNKFRKFVKGIRVKYNSKINTINIFVNYGDKDFSKKYDFEYNIDVVKNEHEESYKPVNNMIVQHDGRIRFTGEFQAVTKFTAQRLDSIESYDNKYESDRNDIEVYFEGNMANGLPEGKGKLVWYNGSPLYEGEFKDGKVTGFGKSYFLDGKLSSEGYRTDGIANGEFIQYFENGQVESKGIMKEGFPFGYGVSYYEDGRLYYIGEYEEGGFCTDGLIYYLSEHIAFRESNEGIFFVDSEGNNIREMSDEVLEKLALIYIAIEAC